MENVVLVTETVEIPSGIKAVKDLVLDVCQKLHDGASIPSLVSSELANLEAAIVSARQLPADVKSAQMPIAMGLLAGQLAAVFLKAPAAPAEVAAPSA